MKLQQITSEYGRKINHCASLINKIRIRDSKCMKKAAMKMTDHEIESVMDDLKDIQSIADKFSDILYEEQKFRFRNK